MARESELGFSLKLLLRAAGTLLGKRTLSALLDADGRSTLGDTLALVSWSRRESWSRLAKRESTEPLRRLAGSGEAPPLITPLIILPLGDEEGDATSRWGDLPPPGDSRLRTQLVALSRMGGGGMAHESGATPRFFLLNEPYGDALVPKSTPPTTGSTRLARVG